MQHLSPPLYFAVNTTLPPLPFESNSFDMIYCGSVFTHIADLAELWLVELRRLLKPGGFLYATVHDKHSLQLLLNKHSSIALSRSLQEANRRTGCTDANFAKMVLARSPKGAQVFYDMEFLRTHWGRLLEIVSVTQEAYGYQTAMVLRKR
jgi:SAM-dependent methyltransferase